MCVKCGEALTLLLDAGYSLEWADNFLWARSAFPAGDNALPQVRALLSVKRRRRAAWLRRDDQLARREMMRAGDPHPWNDPWGRGRPPFRARRHDRQQRVFSRAVLSEPKARPR